MHAVRVVWGRHELMAQGLRTVRVRENFNVNMASLLWRMLCAEL